MRLTGNAGNDHQYLQVCHIQNWGYVCNSEFDHSIDREVVLQQLDCNTGGIIISQCPISDIPRLSIDTSWDIMSTNKGYELGDCPCFGVEKMLINCPRYFKLQQKTCYWKVSVQCDSQGAGELIATYIGASLMHAYSYLWLQAFNYIGMQREENYSVLLFTTQ